MKHPNFQLLNAFDVELRHAACRIRQVLFHHKYLLNVARVRVVTHEDIVRKLVFSIINFVFTIQLVFILKNNKISKLIYFIQAH